MRFTVFVTRPVVDCALVAVEADSPDEALARAVALPERDYYLTCAPRGAGFSCRPLP